MEHIISELLTDFERGHMTRRQLIHALALAAGAASLTAAPALAATADRKGFKAIAVDHISYQVADYAKTRDFYAELLGMKVSGDDGKQAILTFGPDASCLVPRNARQPTAAPKVDHIAYRIEQWDAEAVKTELEARGLNPRLDNVSYHVKDPDGFDVQIAGKV